MFKRITVQQTKINSTFKESPKKKLHQYILIDKRFLHIEDKINFDIFYHDTPTHMTLYLQSDSVIDLKQKDEFEKIEQLYTLKSEREEYDTFLESHIQNVLDDKSLTIDEKTDLVYESTTELTHSLYKNPNALKNVQRTKNIVTPILESILYNNDTISSYIKIIEHDYYTHTHSLNVSIYALCLGAELNISQKRLNILGSAALLHDLGKSKINLDIINKEGKLTEDEFIQMKMHPAYGYDIALEIGIKSVDILDGIRHHHEKLDGSGYPDGLQKDEITLFPRIIAVCDIFDALTTKRSYKDAMSSFDVLLFMKTKMTSHLDSKILNTFIKMLHK